jgi:N-ethylmaleimide reductase
MKTSQRLNTSLKLNDYNLAYIFSEPFTDVSEIPYAVTEIAKHFRPLYNGTLMINSAIKKKEIK